jgi:hypothetical protein
VKSPQEAGIEAALVALGVANGGISPASGARQLLGLAIDMIPVDHLKEYLTDRDRAWADLAADIAEAIKVDAEADAAEKDKLNP